MDADTEPTRLNSDYQSQTSMSEFFLKCMVVLFFNGLGLCSQNEINFPPFSQLWFISTTLIHHIHVAEVDHKMNSLIMKFKLPKEVFSPLTVTAL